MIILFKRIIFKLLDSFVNKNNSPILQVDNANNNNKPILWCFCSTIGELNACKTLISHYESKYQLVLFSDRKVYVDSYLKLFPNAIVVTLTGRQNEIKPIIKQFPPKNVLVCEIPLRLHDAPCRLSFELLFQAKKAGASLFLVNGWLYHYKPSCRQDAIERKLFDKDYVNLFDIITVQTQAIKHEIENLTGIKSNIHVTGNMKFDALSDHSFVIKDDISAQLIKLYQQTDSTIFVAGCVSQFSEYDLVIDAYLQAKKQNDELKLVFVPRHPENDKHLQYIKSRFKAETFSVNFKSSIADLPDALPDVLVIDTFGELKSFYSISTICYVGKNHNILEPLTFKKPVVVLNNWEQSYPSYPVYKAVMDLSLITEITSSNELSHELLDCNNIIKNLSMLDNLCGATSRNKLF